MGSKGGTTQQTTSSSGPPPQVMAEYQGLVDRATNVANQPYQPYQGEQVAPLTSQTQQGLGGINDYANAAQPYYGAAGAMTLGASAPVNPEQFQGMGSLSQYMNPYTQSVVDTTQAEMNNQNQQQAQFLNSANISSGAFGGDRAGIGQSILANQQQLAEAPTIAGLNQANYTQAMSNWTGQQGVNLAAQQANAARQMTGAAQLGGLGTAAQTAGLQGSQAQIQAGMIPQQEQQAIDTAAQQMYQTGQAYPFTTTGWLGNIIEGTGGASGGQSQTTSPGPNSLSQGIGAATSGLGLLGSLISDERLKENVEEIGKTYDGQNIYRYNFKGDPRTQIGLLAQEEAYHEPGSIHRVGMGDLLAVNYKDATEKAADRGHFAMGGAPMGGAAAAMSPGASAAQSGGGGPMTPTMALMAMGDAGARSGLGALTLAGGDDVHPNPGFFRGGRAGFDAGGGATALLASLPADGPQPQGENGQFGFATPGFNAYTDQLSPVAGVPEALFGEETAGTKNPYYGIDSDQIQAIGAGQWMPPRTGAQQPDYGNLQNSQQFGAAEASLKGQFGGGYNPGSTTMGTAPAANSGGMGGGGGGFIQGPVQMGGAPIAGHPGATAGGLSADQLSALASQYFGGGGGGAPAGHALGGRASFDAGGPLDSPGFDPMGASAVIGGSGGGTAPAANAGAGGMGGLSNAPALGSPASAMYQDGYGDWSQLDPLLGHSTIPGQVAGGGSGGANVSAISNPPGLTRARGGRAGFADGGGPQFTTFQPTVTQGGRGSGNAPIYTALDLSHIFGGGGQAPSAIHVQRQLQGQARAKAAVARGLVKPRVIAQDPTTGQHHDITPQNMVRPEAPQSRTFPSWPTPGPGGSGGSPASPGGAVDPSSPVTRFGPKVPPAAAATPPQNDPLGSSVTMGSDPPLEGDIMPPSRELMPQPGGGGGGGGIGQYLPGAIGAGLRRIPGVGQALGMMTPSDQLAPPAQDEAPQWSWPQPQPADSDADLMRMGDEGPQRARGGGVGTHPAIAAMRHIARQGGGGVMGSSPVMNAGAYTPQGQGVTGTTSQGKGVGFGDLYGGGDRAGFADGGDPFLQEITSSIPQGGGGGHGPPAPPPPAAMPQGGGGGGDSMKGAGDDLKKIGGQLKQSLGMGVQTAPTGAPAAPAMPSAGGGWGDIVSGANLDPMFDQLAPDTFDAGGSDFGFATGGGVGLGSLRGNFSDGGDAPDPEAAAIDAAVETPDAPAPGPAPVATGPAPVRTASPLNSVGKVAVAPGGGGPMSLVERVESGGRNIPQQIHDINTDKGTPAGGYFQIIDPTWQRYAGKAGVDVSRYPTAMSAPHDIQAQVAGAIPVNQWGPNTVSALKRQFGNIDTSRTLGEINGGANLPSPNSEEAQASTDSYGGGFQVPPGGAPPQGLQAPTMGDELKHDPWGYLMNVGAGMMASRAPQLGTGIGEGLTAGNKYLEQGRELEVAWRKNQADIANMSQEAREHGADADLKVQDLQYRAQMNKLKLDWLRNSGMTPAGGGPTPTNGPGGAIAPVAPIAPVGGGSPATAQPTPGAGASGATGAGGAGAGAAGAPGAPGAGAQLPKGGAAPAAGSSAQPAAQPAGAPASSSGVPDISQDPDWQRGQALIQQGNQRNAQGGILGFGDKQGEAMVAQGQALVDGATKRWEVQKTIGEKTTEGTIDAQKPVLQEYLTNRQKFESTYDQTRSEISELSNIYQNFQAGRSTEAQADLASWANAFGVKLPQAAGFDAGMKSAIQQAFAAVANSGLQKAPRAGLREATMMVASPTRDPAALRKILTDQLATLDYNHDLYSKVPGHNLNVGDDIEGFTKANKYEDYLGKARKEIPMFKGITPETLKTATGEDWPTPAAPQGVPPGSAYSPSRKLWRDSSGKLYDESGKPQ